MEKAEHEDKTQTKPDEKVRCMKCMIMLVYTQTPNFHLEFDEIRMIQTL